MVQRFTRISWCIPSSIGYSSLYILADTPLEASSGNLNVFLKIIRNFSMLHSSNLVKENPIGSAVSKILQYKQTDRQIDKHTYYYFVISIILFDWRVSFDNHV